MLSIVGGGDCAMNPLASGRFEILVLLSQVAAIVRIIDLNKPCEVKKWW